MIIFPQVNASMVEPVDIPPSLPPPLPAPSSPAPSAEDLGQASQQNHTQMVIQITDQSSLGPCL